MAWLPVCSDCGPLGRTNQLADAKAVAAVHERSHAEQTEGPSRFALCCPKCPWFYEPRTIVMVKNRGFRALILDQHLLVCVAKLPCSTVGVSESDLQGEALP